MNDSITGRAIGTDTDDAQRAAGLAWMETYGGTFASLTQEEQDWAVRELSLTMAQLTGNVDITHMPGFDRITYAPNTGAGLDRPIPALAFQQDGNAHFIALWLKTGTAVTAWTIIATGGSIPTVPAFYSGPMLPDAGAGDPGTSDTYAGGKHYHPSLLSNAIPTRDGGAGSPGVGTSVSRDDHQHPREDPAVASSYLYPSRIPSPLMRAACPSLVYYESPSADLGGPGLDFSEWTQIAGVSTWQYNYPGYQIFVGADPITSLAIPLEDGARFFVPKDFSAASPFTSSPYLGIYEVVHQATPSTAAIIRRASDANTAAGLANGTTTYVPGTYEPTDRYYTLYSTDPVSVDVSILTSELSDEIPGTYALLTSSQIISEGADNTTLEVTEDISGSSPIRFSGYDFVTELGTPGVSELPAGLYGCQIEYVSVGSGSAGATVTLSAKFIDYDNLNTVVLTASSPPIPCSSETIGLAFQGNLASPYAFAPTRRLCVWYYASTTSTTPVDVTFIYSSPTRGTWVKLPISMAGGLTTVPAQNVTPGLLQTGMQTTTTVASIIPTATNNSILVTVDNSLTVNGMSTVNLISGTIFWLTFANACKIANGASVAANQAPFRLGSDYSAGINWNGAAPRTLGSITVQYFASGITGAPCFKLVGGPRA